MSKINLAEKLAQFEGYWQPRVVGAFNGHDLMVVKVRGEFVWHEHADTDARQNKIPENLKQQDQQGNTYQNTRNQGYQQDR